MMSSALAFENMMGLGKASRLPGLCSPHFVCDGFAETKGGGGSRTGFMEEVRAGERGAALKAPKLRWCCFFPLLPGVPSEAGVERGAAWVGKAREPCCSRRLRRGSPAEPAAAARSSRALALPLSLTPRRGSVTSRDSGSWKVMFQSCGTRTETSCEEHVANV